MFAAARTLCADRWLLAALLVMVALYIALWALRPTGENWGHGWNMVAFLIYSAPIALVTAALALWRLVRNTGPARRLAGWVVGAALLFPFVSAVAIWFKT